MPKFRQMYHKFIAEGDKTCIEFAKSTKFEISHIYTTDPRHDITSVKKACPISVIKKDEMAQISALKTPTSVFLVLEMPSTVESIVPQRAIYLDGVQDPGNVGTIIRIADWFGVDTVVRSSESADFYNPKTVQATMGSMANIQLLTLEIDQVAQWKLPIIGTKMEGSPIHTTTLPKQGVLVMGSEGSGISPSTEKFLTQVISIPGSSDRIADSLNVGIATGIICSQWTEKLSK